MSKLTPEFMKQWLTARGWKIRTSVYRRFHDQVARVAKGNVIILHGYRGHVREPHFKNIANAFDDEFFNVVTCDLPNFGKSIPEDMSYYGQVPSFNDLVEVAKALTYAILTSKAKNRVPTFLVGYSVGALTILRFLQRYISVQRYIAGVVFISLPLRVEKNADPKLLRYKKIIEPLLGFIAGTNPHMRVAAYEPDEFSSGDREHFKGDMEIITAKEIFYAANHARTRTDRIHIPTLFVHGADDQTTAPLSEMELAFESISTAPDKKTKIIYPGVGHLVLQQHRYAIADIVAWVNARVAEIPVTKVDREDFDQGLVAQSGRELRAIIASACGQLGKLFISLLREGLARIYRRLRRKP